MRQAQRYVPDRVSSRESKSFTRLFRTKNQFSRYRVTVAAGYRRIPLRRPPVTGFVNAPIYIRHESTRPVRFRFKRRRTCARSLTQTRATTTSPGHLVIAFRPRSSRPLLVYGLYVHPGTSQVTGRLQKN